jgi:N-acetylmuramoyl-L-alanine amidase
MIMIVERKKIILFLIVFFAVFSTVKCMNSFIHTSAVPAGNIIVIDPGHGGRDPGTLGHNGKNEKDINLEISIKLKRLLEKNGYSIVMTRESDISLHDEGAKKKKASDIKNRKKIIEGCNAKLLISIHLNDFQESKYFGAQVFYPKGDETSKKFAETIQGELKSKLDNNNERKAKPINTVVLIRNLDIPSVIVECGFLSNPNEEKLLNTAEYQEKIADAIASGINQFLKTCE